MSKQDAREAIKTEKAIGFSADKLFHLASIINMHYNVKRINPNAPDLSNWLMEIAGVLSIVMDKSIEHRERNGHYCGDELGSNNYCEIMHRRWSEKIFSWMMNQPE